MATFNSPRLLKNLRYGLSSRVWALVARWLISGLGPELAAWLTSLSTEHDDNSGPVILCLSRESFVKDVCELRKRTNFSYAMIMAGFTRFQMAWVPVAMQIQTFYQTYKGDDKNSAIDKSHRYAMRLIAITGKQRKVQAVLSANFDYWQDIGFKHACKTLGIPFVVLSREHPVVPTAIEEVMAWYTKSSYRFDGAVIAVAGSSTKVVIDKVGTVCSQEQVVITGLPRFDAWLDVNVSKPLIQRKYITLLTFTEGYYADNTFKEVLQIFCSMALTTKSEHVKFIIKTKDINDTFAIKKLLGNKIPKNIVYDHDIDLFMVLPESRLVINYNSLSLVEAAMAKASIAIPAWGQCNNRGDDVMYPADDKNVAKVVQFAYSPFDLENILRNCLEGAANQVGDSHYKKFIENYIHLPPVGSCSGEVASLLKKYIGHECTK